MKSSTNALVYDLFFATNHPRGHEKMKEAMWKVDGSGGFSFSDGLDPNQTVLFTENPGDDLAPRLWNRFRGRTVDAVEVYRYAAEKTVFLKKHALAALSLLEAGSARPVGRIQVKAVKADGKARRPGTFPDGTIMRFEDGSETP